MALGLWAAPASWVSWGLSAHQEPPSAVAGAGSPSLGWMDGWTVPSQILDPPTSLGVTGMLPASSRDADGSVGPVGGAPGSCWNQGIRCPGGAVPGAGAWSSRFYTVYVQMQGIKGNGSDCSGLTSWGVTLPEQDQCPCAATSPVLLPQPSLAAVWAPAVAELSVPEEMGELLLAGSGSGLGPWGQAPPAKGWLCQGSPLLLPPAGEEGTVLGGQHWLSPLPGQGAKGCPGGSRPLGAAVALDDPGHSHPTASFPQLSPHWGNGALPVLGMTPRSSPLDGAGLRWGKVPGMAPQPFPERWPGSPHRREGMVCPPKHLPALGGAGCPCLPK